MKIAQVCPYDFSRYGGVKTHILQLSDVLRNVGHEVHIIAPNGAENVHIPHFHAFGKNFSIPFLGTKIDLNAAVGSEYHRLKKFLKDENFDLIHFHTIWNPLLPFQILFLSTSKRIATFHDTPKNNLIGRFLGKYIMPLMARLIFMRLDGIISVSESQAQFINRFSTRNITIIPNGISVPAIRKEATRVANQVLFVGRLEPRKGVLSALKAYKSVHEAYPNVELKIVGEGDLLPAAKDFAKVNNLSNVEFLGKVNDAEKWKMYQTSQVYLAPAEYGESFGIVLIEAMSMGALLCGFANEGYKNVLSQKQLEYFAEPVDVQRLGEHLLKLLHLPADEHMALQLEGKRIAQKYNWEVLVESVLEVYQGTGRP